MMNQKYIGSSLSQSTEHYICSIKDGSYTDKFYSDLRFEADGLKQSRFVKDMDISAHHSIRSSSGSTALRAPIIVVRGTVVIYKCKRGFCEYERGYAFLPKFMKDRVYFQRVGVVSEGS